MPSNISTALSRRAFLGTAGAGSAAVLSGSVNAAASLGARPVPRRALVIWLEGGLSHVDSWDPKPESPSKQFASIVTSVPGMRICEIFPQISAQMHRLSVIRSLVAPSDDHATSVNALEESLAATMHCWRLDRQQPSSTSVVLNGGFSSRSAQTTHPMTRLLASESDSLWERYGDNDFGRSARLALRLLEEGTDLVEIRRGGFDTHTQNAATLRAQAEVIDPAIASLIADLADRGLLADTAVLIATEFGRTPALNTLGGRDHWPAAGSLLLSQCAGHFANPTALGSTDHMGHEILSDAIAVESLPGILTAPSRSL